MIYSCFAASAALLAPGSSSHVGVNPSLGVSHSRSSLSDMSDSDVPMNPSPLDITGSRVPGRPLASTAHSPCPGSPLLSAVTAVAQASLSHPQPSGAGRAVAGSGQCHWLVLPNLPAPGLCFSMA